MTIANRFGVRLIHVTDCSVLSGLKLQYSVAYALLIAAPQLLPTSIA